MSQKKKILIVEDDALLGEILLQKLLSAGYAATLVSDGSISLQAIRNTKPDLVLCDVLLPHLNGIELLEQKIADPSVSAIPVILITNSYQPVSGTHLEELGVIEILIKTKFTPEEILSKVQKALLDTSPQVGTDSLAGKKVLLVEDDSFLTSILSKHLVSCGAKLSYAASGEEALQALEKDTPDIVLLDILLPGVSGFGVLESIRKNPRTRGMKVIVVSNFNQEEDKKKSRDMGAEYLVKALVLPNDIIAKMVEVMGK